MLYNVKIGIRMILEYSFIILLLLIVGGYSLFVIQSLAQKVDVLVYDRMVKSEQATTVIDNLNIIARGLRNIIIDTSEDSQAWELRRISDSRKKIQDSLDQLKMTIRTYKGVEILGKVTESREVYTRDTKYYMMLITSQRIEEAKRVLLTEVRASQRAYMESVEELIDYQKKLARESGDEASSLAQSSPPILSLLMAMAFTISLISLIMITNSITDPINKTVALAEAMAGGDFTIRLAIDQKDEVGLMAKALNSMIEKMAAFMKDIIAGITMLSTSSANLAAVSRHLSAAAHDTAEKSAIVASAAEEMSVNFQSVSAAMEQSSSNVKIIASSTEEMASTINEIGENAEKARAISENAVKQSHLASEKMSALSDSVQKISSVTEAINEISEHTNMLVLHASVEAERAGEAGRGFAIVANEIKAVADQTAIATIDIRQQIDEMQNTKASMAEDISCISGVIENIDVVIGGIATAVEERSATASKIAGTISEAARAIVEVNRNMTLSTLAAADITRNIAKIRLQAYQVGDGSGQVQVSAHGLTDLAYQLQRMVERFRT